MSSAALTQPTPEEPPPAGLTWRELALVGLALGVLSLLMLWPLPRVFARELLGGGDTFVFTWNFWWFKRALLAGQNPFFTDRIYHPTGASLWFHDFSPANNLLALPLVGRLPLPAVLNSLALFSFVATGLATYALTRRVVGHVGGSFVAALVVTFAPYRMGHAMGHLSLISTQWLPLFVLAALRSVDEPRRRWPLLAALAWALCLCSSPYYALYPALFLLAWLPRRARHGLPPGAWRRLALIVVGAVVLTAWFTVPAFLALRREPHGLGAHDPRMFSADLLTFLAPSPVSLFYLPPFSDWWTAAGLYSLAPELSLYLGVVLVGLALVGGVRERAARPWLWVALIFLVLALGPTLRVWGRDTGVPLPYALLAKLPVFRLAGVPARLSFMAVLCLALAAGYGVAALARGRWRGSEWLLAGLVCVEYCCAPVLTTPDPATGFYHRLAAEPGDFAVLDVPDLARAMHCQTLHGKRLLLGRHSYPPHASTRLCEEDKALRALWVTWAKCPEGPDVGPRVRAVLRGVNCRYLIAHGDFRRAWIEGTLGLTKVYEDAELRVYSTAAPAASPARR